MNKCSNRHVPCLTANGTGYYICINPIDIRTVVNSCCRSGESLPSTVAPYKTLTENISVT